MTRSTPSEMTPEEEGCIDACMACHARCTELVEGGIARGATPFDWQHGLLLEDCAELCILAANFTFRRSPRGPEVRMLCARVCLEAATETSRIKTVMARESTEALIRCAQTCQRLTS